VRLRAEVVDLVGVDALDEVRESRAVLEITVDEPQPVIRRVGILVDLLEALGVERRTTPYTS
jgi:hypothetical protein